MILRYQGHVADNVPFCTVLRAHLEDYALRTSDARIKSGTSAESMYGTGKTMQ